jgi:copper homeostasis protein
MAETRKVEGLTLNVIIRPRGGDFLYNEYEIACMEQDIRTCKQLGVDGVVIGALTANGDIDTGTCRRLIAAADGMSITFHRAFDMCRDAKKALEELITLGCDRVLTSGQAATAQDGIPLLKELVEQAAGRITIMPGCGVSSANAAAILQATGATEIHASARKSVGSGMLFRHSGVSMGNPDSDEYARKETDVNEVKAIVESIS